MRTDNLGIANELKQAGGRPNQHQFDFPRKAHQNMPESRRYPNKPGARLAAQGSDDA